MGVDFGVWILNYLGLTRLVLGFPDEGLRGSQEALTLARRLNHPLSLSNALIFNALSCVHRRDWASARSFSEAAATLCREHGFLHYLAITTGQIGWTLAHLGSIDDGIEMGRQGISACMETGMNITMPLALAHQCEGLLAGQQIDAALKSTDQALAWSEKNGEHAYDCLIHCCRGDVLRELNAPERARQEYAAGIAIAQKQGAKFWELRAATSLARLWRDQGKRDEARDLLAPVYGWFTEGFDTRDLKEAKALIDELSS
jgi:predicted ATPase